MYLAGGDKAPDQLDYYTSFEKPISAISQQDHAVSELWMPSPGSRIWRLLKRSGSRFCFLLVRDPEINREGDLDEVSLLEKR